MEILFHDRDIAVCIKPVGMDAEHQVPDAIKSELGGDCFPVHRLDLGVGGVMVYARTKSAAAALSRAIQNGDVVKEYVAVVHGAPPEGGVLEDLLFKDSRKNKVFVVSRPRNGVKAAKLEYRRLQQNDDTSQVLIRLHTGRSHQIRVQFASRGFPLVGDRKYGARDNAASPMLFSCRLTFPHHGKTVTFTALPDWVASIE